jgi:hypothetical protein
MYVFVYSCGSVVNKSRLRYTIYLHLLIILLMLFRLSVSICVIFQVRPPRFLQKLRLPRAELWEYVWLVSGVASIFGLIALRKNRVFLLQQYMIGTVLFGFGTIVYAIFHLLDDLLAYWETRETTHLFLGFPVVVLWNMFLIIALQVHSFGLCFAWSLRQAWKARGESRKIN